MDSYIKWMLITFVLIGAFFFDNIWGYFQFKQVCAAHKELMVYHKLEPNVGWQYDLSKPHTKSAVDSKLYFMPEISFSRYKDFETRLINDVWFIGKRRIAYEDFDWYSERHRNEIKSRTSPENFISKQVDDANSKDVPRYQFEFFRQTIGKRMSQSGFRIRDLRSGKLAVELSTVGYSLFEKNRTLFAASSGILCRPKPALYSTLVKQKIFIKNSAPK